jgi:methionyl aminopeptidase
MDYVDTTINLDYMRVSGEVLKNILVLIEEYIVPGNSTKYLDTIVEEYILDHKCTPSFKGYKRYDGYGDFPTASCISINEEVVHAIPSVTKIIKEDDLVTVDVGVCYTIFNKEHHTDAARTFFAGEKEPKILELTDKCLSEAIKIIRPNKTTVSDVGEVVQRIAETNGYNISAQLGGHGIGQKVHLPPFIPSYKLNEPGALLVPGMYIAIEPILFEGSSTLTIDEDGWTVRTLDRRLSAHFEDTMFISKEGTVVLTR